MLKYAIYKTTPKDVSDPSELNTEDEILVVKTYYNTLKDAVSALSNMKSVLDISNGPNGTKIYKSDRIYVREVTGEPCEFRSFTWAFMVDKGDVLAIAPYGDEGVIYLNGCNEI